MSTDRPHGIKQWVYLPLQRTKTYEYAATLRTRAGTDGETDVGRLRADSGHPASYGVQYWEVGNGLYGR